MRYQDHFHTFFLLNYTGTGGKLLQNLFLLLLMYCLSMCQYDVNDHEVNLSPVLFKLSMSWILVDFLGRICATPPNPFQMNVRSTFCWLSPKRWALQLEPMEVDMTFFVHEFFRFWDLRGGGGSLLVTNWSPKCCFPLIFVWTWSIRCLVGCFCHKHLCSFARRI